MLVEIVPLYEGQDMCSVRDGAVARFLRMPEST